MNTNTAIAEFQAAQSRLIATLGLDAEPWVVSVPAIRGRAQVIEAGDGPPVLFVIGGGAAGAMWLPLIAQLDGFRCIVVDRPGFGLTDRVPHRRAGMRELACSFLADVLDALELDRAAIVGNSMGAWWSTQLALAHPQRVSAMIHIGCPALLLDTSAPAPLRLFGIRGLGALLMGLQQPSTTSARRIYAMLGDPLGENAVDTALVELAVATERLPGYRDTWAELLHAFIRPRGQRPGMAITEDDLRRLHLPLLYVWGERDTFGSPDVGRRAARIAPSAEFVAVDGGHDPWLSDPRSVAAATQRFLSKHQATR